MMQSRENQVCEGVGTGRRRYSRNRRGNRLDGNEKRESPPVADVQTPTEEKRGNSVPKEENRRPKKLDGRPIQETKGGDGNQTGEGDGPRKSRWTRNRAAEGNRRSEENGNRAQDQRRENSFNEKPPKPKMNAGERQFIENRGDTKRKFHRKGNNESIQQFREGKRQIPATTFVSSVRPKFNLIQHRPPPYSALPPRRCDKAKMTILKLKNIDTGVDESLLFWAFKQYGWIDNVYVCRNSFKNRTTGVAFIGFRSDCDAGYATSQSGKVQLFGRRIAVENYSKRASKTRVLHLEAALLTKVFQRLDWRSRVRCEAVCKKFQTTLRRMYDGDSDEQGNKCEWLGLPDEIHVIFHSDKESGEKFQNADNVIRVSVPSGEKKLKNVLQSILRKFSSRISSLEFWNLELNTEIISVIDGGGALLRKLDAPRWDAGRVRLHDCVLNGLSADDFLSFVQYYGDRLVIE